MREIKFRCFYKIDNTMLEVTEINFTGNAITPTCLFWSPEIGLYEAPIEFERDFELMQFTGLKDKKGVEIYDGDIVSHPNSALNGAEIKFTNGLFRIVAKDGRDDLLYYCHNVIEVIGNIYQNKDLLK